MAFLVLLITLGGYKLMGLRFCRRHDTWFYALRSGIERIIGQWPRLVMMLTLLLPVALTGAVLEWLEDTLFGLVGMVLQVVVLFYAFGRGNLIQQVESYQKHWREGDIQSAFHHASNDFRVESCEFDADDVETMHRSVRTGLIYQWFEQIFVILFWYLLAGPLAALFIRLVCLYGDRSQESNKDDGGKQDLEEMMPLQLQHILEWVPARLLGLTFAIAGNFTLCFKTWAEAVLNWSTPTQEVLHKSGMAAIGVCEPTASPCAEGANASGAEMTDAMLATYAEEIQTVQDLIIRSLVVWIVFLSILILT